MTKAILGKTPDGREIEIDVTRLLETRMLVTAASGNGKSRTLRRIAEQTAPLVQQFIFDPEGEFASLRERFDYVICAPSGADAVATPRTAALLARRLLESGVSAILDIYDLKPMERHAFVKNFLEAMINAPKDLWKPVLIILDEAHMFAPQNADCQSTAAVIDMATRGRKRGFCLMPATQRLSKLHKDVAAEMLNKMIGGIELDVDVKRASDDLGKTFKEGRAMLRNLDPGQFYIYGPALVRDITLVKVGDVITTHPGPGQRTMKAPPAPSGRVMKLLGELADLPQQALEEAKTLQDAQVQVRELQRKLGDAERRAAAGGIPEAELEQIRKEEYTRGLEEGYAGGCKDAPQVSPEILAQFGEQLNRIRLAQDGALNISSDWIADIRQRQELRSKQVATAPRAPSRQVTRQPAPQRAAAPAPIQTRAAQDLPSDMTPTKQQILDALAHFEAYGISEPPRQALGAQVGKSINTSTFKNDLSALRGAGLIDYGNGTVHLTHEGRARAQKPDRALSLTEFQDNFMDIVSPTKRDILKVLIELHPEGIDRQGLGEKVGKSVNTSSFKNDISALRSLGALDYLPSGGVVAAELLFPEGLH